MKPTQTTEQPTPIDRTIESERADEELPARSGGLRDMLETLSKLAGPAMTEGQAMGLSGALDEAQDMARRMACLVEGIGVLVSGDALTREAGRGSTGALQDARSIASMLYLIGQSFELVSGLTTVGTEAIHRVAQHARARSET